MQSIKTLLCAGAAAAALAIGSASAQEIKLGAFLGYTGPASLLGDPEKKTLELYVEKYNAAGGVIGKKLKLVMYDTGGEAKNAVTFVKRLLEEDKVDVIIGGTTTGETMAVIPLIEQAGVPFISLGGASVIVEPVKKFTFKTPHTDTMSVSRVYEDMKGRGFAKIGLIAGDGGYDKSCIANAEKLAGKYGITIAANETFGRGDADYTPQLIKIKNAGAQALLFCGFGPSAVILNKNYRQLGLTAPLYHNHGSCSRAILQGSGPAADGIRLPCPAVVVADMLPDSDPQKKPATEYVADYRAKFKDDISIFGASAFDAFLIVVDALKRANTADRAKLRDAIESTKNLATSSGVFNMSPTDHLGLKLTDFKLLDVQGGNWKIVN